MDETEILLIAEQLKRALEGVNHELTMMNRKIDHTKELSDNRLKVLEDASKDHETRIRSATDGVTQFKVWSGLSTGGAWVTAAIALFKNWFV